MENHDATRTPRVGARATEILFAARRAPLPLRPGGAGDREQKITKAYHILSQPYLHILYI